MNPLLEHSRPPNYIRLPRLRSSRRRATSHGTSRTFFASPPPTMSFPPSSPQPPATLQLVPVSQLSPFILPPKNALQFVSAEQPMSCVLTIRHRSARACPSQFGTGPADAPRAGGMCRCVGYARANAVNRPASRFKHIRPSTTRRGRGAPSSSHERSDAQRTRMWQRSSAATGCCKCKCKCNVLRLRRGRPSSFTRPELDLWKPKPNPHSKSKFEFKFAVSLAVPGARRTQLRRKASGGRCRISMPGSRA